VNLADPITVGLILLCAGSAVIAWVGFSCFLHHRRIERSRPPCPSDWSLSVWGDVPQVPRELFHSGTHTPEA
jgi:hypothetical protein